MRILRGSGANVIIQAFLASLEGCQLIDILFTGHPLGGTGNHTPLVGRPTGADIILCNIKNKIIII